MLRRYFSFSLLIFALLAFSSAWGEFPITVNTSLDTFDYDLDHIHLRLEKLDTSWQLLPTGDGKLLVDRLRAKRLVVTKRDDQSRGKDGLPNHVKLPFPIKIQRAEISEVVIIGPGERYTLNNVKFDFDGDDKTLRLDRLRAGTPWGEVDVAIQVGVVHPFPLTGTIALAHPGGEIPYDLKAQLSGNLKILQFDTAAMLWARDGKIALLQNDNSASAAARISVNAKLGLMENFPLTANAMVTELHPDRLGSYPVALLNLDLNLQGTLQPEPIFNLQFAAHDSQWQKQTLSGSGKMLIEGRQIRNIDVLAGIAANQVKVSGSLGQPDSHLEWFADLPELPAFGPDYAGKVQAHGTIDGTFENSALRLSLLAEKLHLPGDLRTERLQGQAALKAGDNGKFEGEFSASNLQYRQHTVLDGRLTLQGTRANHQFKLTLEDNKHRLESVLQGGLSATNRWHGWVQSLAYLGNTPVTLQAPAPLSIDSTGASLEKAILQLAAGRVSIDLLQIGPGLLVSKGHLDQLAWGDLAPVPLALPLLLQGNPVFSGQWEINGSDSLNGSISLWREAGDLSLTKIDGLTSPLGLQEIRAEMKFVNNHAELKAKLNGKNLGDLNFRLETVISKTDSGYVLLASAPVTLKGSGQLNTIAWLPRPPMLMDASIDGQLTLSVQADGTLGAPNLSGMFNGQNLEFNLPSEGIALKDGVLEATFSNDRLLVKQVLWQGGEGYLHASGWWQMSSGQPSVYLDWTAEKFTATSRADRLLKVSGTGKTILEADMLTITGDFSIVKGLIELADEDTPELGDDVVVVDQPDLTPEPETKILLNGLRIDLGKEFILRGRGLDAELSGALTLTGLTQFHPHTTGGIQVRKGTYMAYGQVLNIERGILNFSGPVDNPGLNIRAMRNSKPVNAGIEINGSAFQPVTRLVSDPNVPDSEKLSWLVLGYGMDQAGKNDLAMLSLAAGILLSQGQSVPLQTQIARAAGLDEFGISGSEAEGAVVTFGKRLTSRLFLSYEKSFSGLMDVVRLTFNITPRWSLRAEAGTESAVDVLYSFSFK